MKAYKGFDKDLKCRDFQYEIGKTYTHNGDVEPCESGFHACEYPLDVFNYYPSAGSRFAEVETSGKIVPQGDKICCEKIKVKTELTLGALIQAAVNFTFERANWIKDSQTKKEKGAASATGDRGAASATGDRGAASATGLRGAASATGDFGAASATGNYGAASATGLRGAASATGDFGAASATGYYGAASATGDFGAASATGDFGAASATGYYGAASATGDFGATSATGYYGAASATGYESIACGLGFQCKAKGAKGCWLVLAERKIDGEILSIKAAQVDGKKIKENTYYQLVNGKFMEAEK